MLLRLHLRDFVIVSELDIDLAGGFTVLTGETGAGKSILVDALKLALGERSDAGVVRQGATRAEITAEFLPSKELTAWLDEQGFDTQSETVLLRRVIDVQGRSRGYVNGSAATAAQLKAAGEQLVDIHGQHAYQGLVRRDVVTRLLDGYAGAGEEAGAMERAWHAWRSAQDALEQARTDAGRLADERERQAWQVEELDRLAPLPDEWAQLEAEQHRLANVHQLREQLEMARGVLDGDEAGVLRLLGQAQHAVEQATELDPELQPYRQQIETAADTLADLAHELRRAADRTEADPDRLAEVDARLSAWMALARKYRTAPAELPELRRIAHERLGQLDREVDLPELERTAAQAEKTMRSAAKALTTRRRQAAAALATQIQARMQDLSMTGGRFEVGLLPLDPPTARGAEAVELRVAAHPGTEPRSLARVASGGELSRIALAVAVVTSTLQDAPTLIFDEIDAGIGGAVAQTVGRLLARLGQDRQVLAVTHLAQVAACATRHLRVEKQSTESGTNSSLLAIDGAVRRAEIARMLGGDATSEAALAHAGELLEGGGSRGKRAAKT